MKKLRWWIVLVVVVAGGIAGGLYYRANGGKNPDKYRTEVVGRGTVAEVVTATGTISAVTTVQVGSQVSGIVSRLYVDFNSPVKKGELLAELDPTPLQAQVEQRRADVAHANVELRGAELLLRRNERLIADGLVAQADYDGARTAYDAAKTDVDQTSAALRQAMTNLSYAKIFSPIDGVVVARQYDIGQTVAASFQAPTLFTIAEDLTKMQVRADVDQSDIGRVTLGQTARFTVDAFPDENFQGTISQIRLNATQNQNVITYPVIIDVANPDLKLKPTMTADVTIEVAKVQDTLRVPNGALRFRPIVTGATGAAGATGASGGGARGTGGLAGAAASLGKGQRAPRKEQSVYVVGTDGEPKAVPVKIGISDGRFTAIVGGDLKEGDKVIVALATAKVETTGTFPGTTGGRGGR
jgi:HlyD family secretion protein